MSEYTDREIGPLTRAALENYLHPKSIEQRIYELEQRISDVNDANLYGLSQLEERIDALERRIEKLEQRMDGKDDMDGEMLLAIGKRLCAVERKLNHKGGNE